MVTEVMKDHCWCGHCGMGLSERSFWISLRGWGTDQTSRSNKDYCLIIPDSDQVSSVFIQTRRTRPPQMRNWCSPVSVGWQQSLWGGGWNNMTMVRRGWVRIPCSRRGTMASIVTRPQPHSSEKVSRRKWLDSYEDHQHPRAW